MTTDDSFARLDALTVADLRQRTNAKWRKYDADVIPAWVADMDFPIAEPLADLLRARAELGDLGYASSDDDDAALAAFRAWQQTEHSWDTSALDAMTVGDVMQGVAVAIHTLTDPGDGVVVCTPAYHPFFPAIEDAGRRLVAVALTPDHGLDLAALDRAAADARLLLWCNPHNPTGRAFTADELASVAELAATHDLVVVSDEIHADLVHPGHRHRPFAALDADTAARTVTVTSASKSFAMPSLANAVAAGPERLLDAMRALPAGLAGHTGALGHAALTVAWTEGRPWLGAVRDRILANHATVSNRLGTFGLDAPVPDATYLRWIDCAGLRWSEEPAGRFLREGRVGLDAGGRFGPHTGSFVRLNVATSAIVLHEILDRMVAVMEA